MVLPGAEEDLETCDQPLLSKEERALLAKMEHDRDMLEVARALNPKVFRTITPRPHASNVEQDTFDRRKRQADARRGIETGAGRI